MEAQVPEGRPDIAGAVYGQILVTSVVAAFSEDDTIEADAIFVGVLVTMVVFWLAHVYARAVAVRVGRTTNLSLVEVRDIAESEWPLVQAAVPSLVAIGLGWAGVLSLDAAVALAIGLGVLALFLWGYVIARRSRMKWQATIVSMALSGSFGLAMVGLKILVH